jgi:hypothetical protein
MEIDCCGRVFVDDVHSCVCSICPESLGKSTLTKHTSDLFNDCAVHPFSYPVLLRGVCTCLTIPFLRFTDLPLRDLTLRDLTLIYHSSYEVNN